jgi:transcriptional regulator with XRE-family HTH domain
MSLVTGNQLKAARVLAEVDQQQVADAANVNVNTIRNMEARGNEPITSSAVTVRKVQSVLEAWGVEFLDAGVPGVRRRPDAPVASAPSKPAASKAKAAAAKPRSAGLAGKGKREG